MDCDAIKTVETMNRSVSIDEYIPPTRKEIGVCEKCRGKLKDDIKPMCPACR